MPSPTLTIAKRQWLSYFNSPVAYVFICLFLVLINVLTWLFGHLYEARQASLTNLHMWIPWVYAIIVPAISMGLWAEERRSHTIELLMTMPVTPTQAVLGKFLAAWGLMGVVVLFTLPFAFTMIALGDPDNGPLWGGYLAMFLLGGANLAIGMFASSITRSQVIAFILAAVVCFLLILAGFGPVTGFLYEYLPGWITDGIAATGTLSHYNNMSKGVIALTDLFYFFSIIGCMVFFTVLQVCNRDSR